MATRVSKAVWSLAAAVALAGLIVVPVTCSAAGGPPKAGDEVYYRAPDEPFPRIWVVERAAESGQSYLLTDPETGEKRYVTGTLRMRTGF